MAPRESKRIKYTPDPTGTAPVSYSTVEDGKCSNTGSPDGAVHAATGTPRGVGRAGRVAERSVGLKTRGNARRGKGPQVRRDDGGAKARGSGFAYEPRVKGQGVPKHHMRKRRGRADRWEARCCQGVNRPDSASERGTVVEAVQLLGAGGTQATDTASDRRWLGAVPNWRSVCEGHDPTGEPDAGVMLRSWLC